MVTFQGIYIATHKKRRHNFEGVWFCIKSVRSFFEEFIVNAQFYNNKKKINCDYQDSVRAERKGDKEWKYVIAFLFILCKL